MKMNASQQAQQWAMKKKEMLEKAQRQKEERKQNLQTTGELSLGQKYGGSMQEQPRSSSQQRQMAMDNQNYRKQFNPQIEYEDIRAPPQRQNSGNRKQDMVFDNPQPKYGQQYTQQIPNYNQQPQKQQAATFSNSNKPPSYNKPPSQEGTRQRPPQQPQPRQQQAPPQQKQPPPQQKQPVTSSRNNLNNKKVETINTVSYNNPFDEVPIKKSGPVVPQVQNEALYECSQGCRRSFNQKALAKHEPICVKVFQKKRKEFNVQKQRIISNEQVKYIKQQPQIEKKYQKAEQKKHQWKQQSEAFRAALKMARGGKVTAAQQQAFSQAQYSDYIQCPHCGRNFNEQAGNRHIISCAQRSKIPPRKRK
ncbi:Zinc finger C2HC domain-containing protein 1A [Paramecium bursaria]